jgi:hypothetical protein
MYNMHNCHHVQIKYCTLHLARANKRSSTFQFFLLLLRPSSPPISTTCRIVTKCISVLSTCGRGIVLNILWEEWCRHVVLLRTVRNECRRCVPLYKCEWSILH